MSNLNALIAAGPHTQGVDVAGNMMKVQQLKNLQQRNQLADIQNARLQRQDERAEQDFALKLDKNDWDLLRRTAQEFVGIYDSTGDIKSASAAMESLPDRGRLGKLKRDYFAALETPERDDDEAILANARVVASMNPGDGSVRVQSVKEAANGDLLQFMSDGSVVNSGQKAANPNFRYTTRKRIDQNGNEIVEVVRLDPTNRVGPDGMVTQTVNEVPVQTDNPAEFMSRLPPDSIAPSREQPQQATGGASVVSQATSPVEGMAAQEAAKEGAKKTEQRFANIKETAPSDARMSSFIAKISANALDAAKEIKSIIQKNPKFATGFWTQWIVDDDGEKKKINNFPGDWDEPAIQVSNLLDQLFGGTAFTTLQQMRAASPTGGALGQVSNFEVDLLKTQMGAFSQDLNAGSADKAIDKVINQASLVNELALAELAVKQELQALGPDSTNEDVAALVNAGFENMREIYKRYGRDSGEWNSETLEWTPPSNRSSGKNEGEESIEDILARNSDG